MKELAAFLIQAVVISLSGVMAPGPMTVATITAGSRRKHAGLLIAVGHAIVELPLIVLITVGLAKVFQYQSFRIAVGLAGGTVLLAMGAGMLKQPGAAASFERHGKKGPILTGVLLSAGNPYFLLWWATVGLALATQAVRLGVLALGLFAVVHWLCDVIWLEVLSLAAFKGSKLLGERSGLIIRLVCAAVLLVFGLVFVLRAAWPLLGPT